MIIVGLTGGIATGKSLVSHRLAELGALMVDADTIAHDVMKQGTPAWKEVVNMFGREYLLPDGELNRKALGRVIFHDAARKEQLNQIVHPRVFERISQAIVEIINETEAPDTIVILDVPLLYESGMYRDVSDIIVVYATPAQQLERLMARDPLTEVDARARIHSQLSIEEKKEKADMFIDNSGTIEETLAQVDKIFVLLKEKASNHS